MSTTFDLAKFSQPERQFLTRETTWTDKLMDHETLKARIPLSLLPPSTSATCRTSPSLGDLEKLPMELLHTVFRELPVANILSLYRTNSRSQAVLSSWPSLALVNQYGQNAIRALIASQSAHRYTFPQLESVVFSSECEFCQEHGEILYLLKLVRCCFRCLSTDRRLLAVNTTYAVNVLQVPSSELRKLPLFTTAPQDHHWGSQLGQLSVVDYTAALRVSKAKQTDREIGYDWSRAHMSKNTLSLSGTEINLPTMWQSVHPTPGLTIQDRRTTQNDLPLLSLPWAITRPFEGPSGQHACSVFFPAVKRTSVKPAGANTFYYKYETQAARHCSGCAHWWNYHSTMPFEYHTIYRGTISDLSSPLMSHLSHCIYARMFWQKLWTVTPTRAQMIINGHNSNQLRISRWGNRDQELNASSFEMFSSEGLYMIEGYKLRGGAFTQSTAWALSESDGEEHDPVIVPAVPKDANDGYGDLLFSAEALSQAHWATATPLSRNDLFHGPFGLVNEKRGREMRRIQKQRRHGKNVGRRGIWQGPWTFDLFG